MTGKIESGRLGLGPAQVTLYQAGNGSTSAKVLGMDSGSSRGNFKVSFAPPADAAAVLYLVAEVDSEVVLATVLGTKRWARRVVINERSTVATAYAMAQFIDSDNISGKSPGLENAASMLRSVVDVGTGKVSRVLRRPPNGKATTAWAELNSLANMLARCVNDSTDCDDLFALSEARDGSRATNTLQAMINIAHNPAKNADDLFAYSQTFALYHPALDASDSPDAWTLALRFTDRRRILDGPGLVALDRHGNAWANNNYLNARKPERICGDNHLLAFGPDGAELRGSPFGGRYRDGGLYGAGFGIGIDPLNDIWVGNFGFTGSECAINGTQELTLLSSSVSQFDGKGRAVSPSTSRKPPPYGGWRSSDADILQPQGTVSDANGNIWLANCGNASVTKLENGQITEAKNFVPLDDAGDQLLLKPFGAAIDSDGNAWITSNGNDRAVALKPDGAVHFVIPDDVSGLPTNPLNLPMGIVSDRNGNIWIANSGGARPPCGGDLDEDRLSEEDATAEEALPNASVSVYLPKTGELKTFSNVAGVFMPWGIAIDGNNDVWVANFGGPRSGLIGVSQLCGVESSTCAADEVGKAISPDTGYTSNGLSRNTGVSIDASGNVWMANNWLRDIDLENPGGHELVVFLGLAGPVKTPLVGPPERP